MNTKDPIEKDIKINDVPPRENVGRDTIARYRAQFRATAFACLKILEGKTIDRVYCDYQDDFVSRTVSGKKTVYHFYQVKTKKKKNHQWSINEIFGLKKTAKEQDPEKISHSFAGKLLFHTVKFKASCTSVVFLTNIHIKDDVEDLVNAMRGGKTENQMYEYLVSTFNDAYKLDPQLTPDEIKKLLAKFELEPNIGFLHPDDTDFSALVRNAIFRFSEVDLAHGECEEIVRNLLSLIEEKSFQELIEDIEENELDDLAGVGISDLLEILSISKGAYESLISGGDPFAIRNASIIQRKLSEAGAPPAFIEFASQCKVQWDDWFRAKRHTLPEFDLNFLLTEISSIHANWISGKLKMSDLQAEIEKLWEKVGAQGISDTLQKELLLGGILSDLVRGESR